MRSPNAKLIRFYTVFIIREICLAGFIWARLNNVEVNVLLGTMQGTNVFRIMNEFKNLELTNFHRKPLLKS